jgi:hypothetical protein
LNEDRSGKKVSEREDWIPLVSVVLLAALLFVSDFNYRVIETGTTLFFYAVLVQMWTELGPDEPLFVTRDLQFVVFILMAVGAVSVGYLFRELITFITGSVLAVQSLAIGIILSRAYINAKDAENLSLESVLRYNDPFDQRLVLIPCTVVFFLPVAKNWLGINLIDFETTTGFTGLTLVSILSGIVYHEYETGELEAYYQRFRDN